MFAKRGFFSPRHLPSLVCSFVMANEAKQTLFLATYVYLFPLFCSAEGWIQVLAYDKHTLLLSYLQPIIILYSPKQSIFSHPQEQEELRTYRDSHRPYESGRCSYAQIPRKTRRAGVVLIQWCYSLFSLRKSIYCYYYMCGGVCAQVRGHFGVCFSFIFMRVLGIELILLDLCGCWTISLVPGTVVVKCLHCLLERVDYSLPDIIFITMICYSWVVCDHVTLEFSAHWYLCVDDLCPWPQLTGFYPQELSKYIFPFFPLCS